MPVTLPSPGTIAVYSDIGCPWAQLCVHRLHRARRRHGLEEAVRIEHRPFPLELVNRRATPKRLVEAEVAVVAGLDDAVEWRLWEAPVETYPVTTLLAMEAVQAATEQGPRVAEALDLALRDAMFRHSRCISLLHVVLEVARGVPGCDADALAAALQDGRARHRVRCAPEEVKGSPHLFVAGAAEGVFNPGLTVRVLEGHLPVVEGDDSSVVESLVLRAAGR